MPVRQILEKIFRKNGFPSTSLSKSSTFPFHGFKNKSSCRESRVDVAHIIPQVRFSAPSLNSASMCKCRLFVVEVVQVVCCSDLLSKLLTSMSHILERSCVDIREGHPSRPSDTPHNGAYRAEVVRFNPQERVPVLLIVKEITEVVFTLISKGEYDKSSPTFALRTCFWCERSCSLLVLQRGVVSGTMFHEMGERL